MIVTDIEKRPLSVGDEVYYAKKRDYGHNGIMVRAKISNIDPKGNVYMKPLGGGTSTYKSTDPSSQLLIMI